MKLIHLDTIGGIAGDMFVAALIDAFPDLRDRVIADVRAVLPAEVGRPSIEEGESGGIRALRFRLVAESPMSHAPSGSFRAMAARIAATDLASGTGNHAIAILTILGLAEASIHGIPLDDVHFHEIADWDSLLDVVAAGSIAAALDGAKWTVSPLPRGGGAVQTEHGLLPVPAPATALILTGFEWRNDGVSGERVSPTGAAILKHLISENDTNVATRLVATGIGAGVRCLPDIPNIVRALVFRAAPASFEDSVTVIAFEVDDMTGEEVGVAANRLRAFEGVIDLTIGQRWGKKDRPLQSFQLLVRHGHSEAAANRCFVETSTIGLRISEQRRVVLPRVHERSDGINIKAVVRPNRTTTRKAESDDLRADSLVARRAQRAKAEDEDQ